MFDTNYSNRKDHRRPYFGTERVDRSCRPHGGCPHCESGRMHNARRREPADLREQLAEAVPDEVRMVYGDFDFELDPPADR